MSSGSSSLVSSSPTSDSTGDDEGLPLLESGELHLRRPKSSSSLSSSVAPRVKTTETTIHNALIKYGSLLLLVGQMVGLVLVMRYSRTHISNGEMYLASTAVFMMEVRNIHLPEYVLILFHRILRLCLVRIIHYWTSKYWQSSKQPVAENNALVIHTSFCYKILSHLEQN